MVAAGNDGYNTAYFCPEHLTKAVVVAAVDKNDQRALFPNYGDSVDVAALGVGVVSCVPGGGYKSLNGTSMAAPHVAVVAAMFRLKYPSKTPAQIEALLKNNVRDFGGSGKDRYYDHSILDLSKVNTVQPTGVTLSKTSVSITVGGTVTLTATVQSSNATEKTITRSSGNTSIAKVKNGIVTGVSAGTVTITAKTANGKKASCTVKVAPKTIQPTGGTLNKSALTMEEGISAGTTTIEASTANGKTASCRVTVEEIFPESISVTAPGQVSPLCMGIGERMALSAAVQPAGAVQATVTWSSSNSSVAVVDSQGIVTGKAEGAVTITAATQNGVKGSCSIRVKPAVVKAEEITYKQTLGGDLIVDAVIYLKDPPAFNGNKYILYYAYKNGYR